MVLGSALLLAEPITKEAVKERLDLLEKERIQQMANLNALNGAIEDCKFWLSQLDAKPAEQKNKLKTPPPPGHPPKAKKE